MINKNKVRIAASVLNSDFLNLADELKKVQRAGIDLIHLDVMDGHFVPNLSFGVPILKTIKPVVDVPIYSHLMVIEPENLIDKFLPDSDAVIFHIEATKKVQHCINMINKSGKFKALGTDVVVEIVLRDKKEKTIRHCFCWSKWLRKNN